MNAPRTHLGKVLRAARIKAGLTQVEVASALDYDTAQFISNWERGQSKPPAKCLAVLATLYNISLNRLIKAVGECITLEAEMERRDLVAVVKEAANA